MKKIITILLLSLTLFGCKKKEIKPEPETHTYTLKITGYICGYMTATINGQTVECIDIESGVEVKTGDKIKFIGTGQDSWSFPGGYKSEGPINVKVYQDSKPIYVKQCNCDAYFETTIE